MAYPLMLTTPDQVFLTSMNYYGCDKILSLYPLSNIIIDEIQNVTLTNYGDAWSIAGFNGLGAFFNGSAHSHGVGCH